MDLDRAGAAADRADQIGALEGAIGLSGEETHEALLDGAQEGVEEDCRWAGGVPVTPPAVAGWAGPPGAERRGIR
jgi:hypothetical protein